MVTRRSHQAGERAFDRQGNDVKAGCGRFGHHGSTVQRLVVDAQTPGPLARWRAFRHAADRPGAIGAKVGEQPDDVAFRDAMALHDLVAHLVFELEIGEKAARRDIAEGLCANWQRRGDRVRDRIRHVSKGHVPIVLGRQLTDGFLNRLKMDIENGRDRLTFYGILSSMAAPRS